MSTRGFSLLPPDSSKCQCCAVVHPPEHPHDATSLFYQFWFHREYGRSPTWNDALAHCPEALYQHWHLHLNRLGIDPDSTSTRGGIKTAKQLAARLDGIARLYRAYFLDREYQLGSIAIDPSDRRLILIKIDRNPLNRNCWIGVLQLLSERAVGFEVPTILLADRIEDLEKING